MELSPHRAGEARGSWGLGVGGRVALCSLPDLTLALFHHLELGFKAQTLGNPPHRHQDPTSAAFESPHFA